VSGIETAVIALGVVVAKAVCGVWLGESKVAGAVVENVIDLAVRRLISVREQRRFRRLWDQAAELVADRLEPLLAHEYRDLSENERLAAVDAVRSTFESAELTEADLFRQDLDAGFLDRYLRRQDPQRLVLAGLSSDASPLYNLLLRECCAYAIELVSALPSASVAGTAELLRRDRQLLDDMRVVLERLPARRGISDFERDYRQLVANVHDRVELFGVTLAESSRRYPLSVAYLSLTVSGEFRLRRPGGSAYDLSRFESEPEATTPTARVEQVLASTQRLFVRGDAGLGKTTLLQWVAVQSARGSFPEQLVDWNGTVPFLVVLRRYASGNLPTPEHFVARAGRHIAAEMPPGWVHDQLRSGRAAVLVDGVDELPEARRGEVRQWLHELVTAFPAARYVVTSRPAAVATDWLGREDFDVAELEPMSPADVPVFVHRWHQAMREQAESEDQRAVLTSYERRLLGALASQRHLRSLAGYPLLCALLCALHCDRRGQLPGSRMELFDVALQMLLERRDRERQVEPALSLTRTDQTLILRDLAYWFIRNGWTSAQAQRVRERVASKLSGMTKIKASPDDVYRLLAERSGLLREPVEGHTDFVHRTFQDYLAAAEAVASDDIGVLVTNGWTDQWSEVVMMAAGHATVKQRTELIRGLLDGAANERSSRRISALRLLAVACLETSPELPPDLRAEVDRVASTLLPPKTMAAAKTLAKSCGEFALDLLVRAEPQTAAEVAATIRAAAEIGDPAALSLLARFGRETRKPVLRELLRAWPRFDPEDYARRVLAQSPLDNGRFEMADLQLVPGLRHLENLSGLDVNVRMTAGPVEIEFVRDLPGLRRLDVVATISDLAPLAGSRLEVLRQTRWVEGSDDCALSLRPLETVGELSELMIWGQPVTEIPTLYKLDHLTKLYLHCLDTAAALAEFVPLRELEALSVGRMPDLTSLEALRFLAQPRTIYVYGCDALVDVSALGQWPSTLSSVQLEHCPAVDLTTLRSARDIGYLDLWGSGALDLSAIADMPRLTSVMLGDGPLPNLQPLRRLPALQWLYVRHVSSVDLSELAGREGLTVQVDRSTTVHGAERLGPGSRVIRR
jgi:NACHT conflict system protein/NACHT domain-containing protein